MNHNFPALGLGQGQLQSILLAGGGIAGTGVLEPLVDLGADQLWVGEQAGDVVPDDRVEVVGPDRLAVSDARAADPPP